ncbi:hypothetical protein JOB18_017200 [Solea senegalensis]|uniref:Uncharacterized protein n=1 Tax=Solea senegalensis TaxID=28829 RepID=A0AAV6SB24_SOLSE|nr:hypothetical protein JOB18_017200 [Solea senegalensis]
MFSYTAYPNDAQRFEVAQALVEKHPCLKEPGSFNGTYGWQQSLKYKCGNNRTKRKALGSPELLLDRYTPKLLELFSAKGGVTGQRFKNLLMELIQDPSASAVKKRDVTLRGLIEYMGESGQELISDYCGTA